MAFVLFLLLLHVKTPRNNAYLYFVVLYCQESNRWLKLKYEFNVEFYIPTGALLDIREFDTQ